MNIFLISLVVERTSEICITARGFCPVFFGSVHNEQGFACLRCGHKAHADTNAGKVIAGRGMKSVRDQTVVVNCEKRCAYKRRLKTGRESSGVPVDADVSWGDAQAESAQW